jgi:D-alanine-D-alanine ligase
LEEALGKAFAEDNQVLVEECISGREFTIGVFKTKGEIITLPITEIISQNEFFDFQAKYEGASQEVTPANVATEIADKIRAEAVKAYQVFNCNGVVRIDFIFNESAQRPYLLEINTVPGQSAASIIPQQVKAMGWSLKEFYSALLAECFQ